MFNNCDQKTNGEEAFYKKIRERIRVVFDVGCRSDSLFTEFEGEVHYFDPMPAFIENLKMQPNQNKTAVFNTFGLGDANKEVFYYPKYESFCDRTVSCTVSDDANKVLLRMKRGADCVGDLQGIDFLKIDTEGFELNVLQGFGDFLEKIKIIQFEYGGTYLDNNVKLIDVVKYLEDHGFHQFSYLTHEGPILIKDFSDHYAYCNVVCVHKSSDILF